MPCQLQICQNLGSMHWENLLNGFEFNDHGVIHEQIKPKSRIQREPVIVDGQQNLLLGR